MLQPVCLFDMDNTLFDYLGQLRRDMLSIVAPDEQLPDDLHEESKPYLKARMGLIKRQPGWWRNLPIYRPGWDLYELARELGYKCHILTKGPSSIPMAWMEKVECIKMHFDDSVSIDIVGEDKTRTFGRVLVDDYPEYVLGWLAKRPRGLAVMPKHSYNADTKHPNVIIYDGSNIEEVGRLMLAAVARQDGQHWKEKLKA